MTNPPERKKNIIKEMSAEMPPIEEFTRVKNQVYYQQGGGDEQYTQ